MKVTAISALLVVAAAVSLAAQSPTPTSQPPKFAIASIKLGAPPNSGPIFFDFGARPGGQWFAKNATFVALLRSAYPAFSLPGQVVGGPAWMTTQRFDVDARADGDPPSDVMTEMLKRLLADRFSLKVHTEQREVDVYALVLARPDGRLGPGLRKAAVDCQAIADARKRAADAGGARPAPPAPPKPGERPQCGMMSSSMNGVQRLAAGGALISAIAPVVQLTVGRPIVDHTGLAGLFDIDLEYAGTTQLATSPDQPNAPASVFTAVQEQLGLKLESRKQTMDVLVIDQVEMPTEN